MASEPPVASADGAEEADLAKAFQELAKGERTATALENQLSAMEARLDALLQQAEREQEDVQRIKGEKNGSNADASSADSSESNEKTE